MLIVSAVRAGFAFRYPGFEANPFTSLLGASRRYCGPSRPIQSIVFFHALFNIYFDPQIKTYLRIQIGFACQCFSPLSQTSTNLLAAISMGCVFKVFVFAFYIFKSQGVKIESYSYTWQSGKNRAFRNSGLDGLYLEKIGNLKLNSL